MLNIHHFIKHHIVVKSCGKTLNLTASASLSFNWLSQKFYDFSRHWYPHWLSLRAELRFRSNWEFVTLSYGLSFFCWYSWIWFIDYMFFLICESLFLKKNLDLMYRNLLDFFLFKFFSICGWIWFIDLVWVTCWIIDLFGRKEV